MGGWVGGWVGGWMGRQRRTRRFERATGSLGWWGGWVGTCVMVISLSSSIHPHPPTQSVSQSTHPPTLTTKTGGRGGRGGGRNRTDFRLEVTDLPDRTSWQDLKVLQPPTHPPTHPPTQPIAHSSSFKPPPPPPPTHPPTSTGLLQTRGRRPVCRCEPGRGGGG